MYHYTVFGGRLRSEFPLSELPQCVPSRADWTLTVLDGPPDRSGWHLAGQQEAGNGVMRLFRSIRGCHIDYSDRLTLSVSASGDVIELFAAPGLPYDLVSSAVLGPALALSLHASGTLCLHGSAVAVGDGAIGFLAPKYHGKSTLALALVGAGATLLTDDTLAVKVAGRPLALPGVHSVRLWDDSIAALPRVHGRVVDCPKRILVDFPTSAVASAGRPLRALYLLEPVPRDPSDAAANRAQLDAVHAALAVVGHSKMGALMGTGEAPQLLERSARIARAVPVFALEVARGFERLADVVETILEWHPPLVRVSA